MHNSIISTHYTFFDLDGNIINNVSSITLDSLGEFSSITYTGNDGLPHSIPVGEFKYTNLILKIPNLGFAYCGDHVFLQEYRKNTQEYILDFGWHENISNQQIYSWYLKKFNAKGELECNKTLYYDDLVNIIAVQNRVIGFVPSDLEV